MLIRCSPIAWSNLVFSPIGEAWSVACLASVSQGPGIGRHEFVPSLNVVIDSFFSFVFLV